MRKLYLLVAFTIGCLATCAVLAQEKKEPVAPPVTTATKVFELQTQQYGLLKQACEILKQQYASGVCSLDVLLEAEVALARAELELAPNPTARQVVHERIITRLRDQQAYVEGKFQAGTSGKVDVLMAKSATLRAEIDMLRDRDE